MQAASPALLMQLAAAAQAQAPQRAQLPVPVQPQVQPAVQTALPAAPLPAAPSSAPAAVLASLRMPAAAAAATDSHARLVAEQHERLRLLAEAVGAAPAAVTTGMNEGPTGHDPAPVAGDKSHGGAHS